MSQSIVWCTYAMLFGVMQCLSQIHILDQVRIHILKLIQLKDHSVIVLHQLMDMTMSVLQIFKIERTHMSLTSHHDELFETLIQIISTHDFAFIVVFFRLPLCIHLHSMCVNNSNLLSVFIWCWCDFCFTRVNESH